MVFIPRICNFQVSLINSLKIYFLMFLRPEQPEVWKDSRNQQINGDKTMLGSLCSFGLLKPGGRLQLKLEVCSSFAQTVFLSSARTNPVKPRLPFKTELRAVPGAGLLGVMNVSTGRLLISVVCVLLRWNSITALEEYPLTV